MLRILCAILCLLSLLPSTSPPLASSTSPAWQSGTCVHYAESWGTWTCPPDQKCGIAARQGVKVLPGETPVAYWDCAKLKRRGLLRIAGRTIPVVVADCGRQKDVPALLRMRTVGELPYGAAEELGLTRAGRMECSLLLFPVTMRRPAPPTGRQCRRE